MSLLIISVNVLMMRLYAQLYYDVAAARCLGVLYSELYDPGLMMCEKLNS